MIPTQKTADPPLRPPETTKGTPQPSSPCKPKKEIPPQVRQQIVHLHEIGYGTRKIARCVNETRKVVRRVLREAGDNPKPTNSKTGKVSPFLPQVEEKVLKGLTTTRILREIRALGYDGGRTILAEQVRKLRVQHALLPPKKRVKRRFETPPGRESQADWSPFNVYIAGQLITIYALSVILCHCRKLFLTFFRNDNKYSLLEGLAMAWEYFLGCTIDLVIDNMATAVLGRYGPDRKVIWHPLFQEFARHYGFNPYACAVRDADRKGKDEKPWRLVFDDFLKGREFESWEHLLRECKIWLDETPDAGNLRIHGTTGERPNDAFLAERDFLIRLPSERFPFYEDSIRSVYARDSTLSIHERKYTVPTYLAGRDVNVRLFAHHFEVIDPNGNIAFSRTYAGPEEKRRLLIEPTHYANLPRRSRDTVNKVRLDEAFLRRFPTLAPLVDGLKLKVKTLVYVHLRALLRLTERYGEEKFLPAATRAQDYHRFDASAVERILRIQYPEPPDEPIPPITGAGAYALGEAVDPGSLDDYDHLDRAAPTPQHEEDAEETE
jgi:transposase